MNILSRYANYAIPIKKENLSIAANIHNCTIQQNESMCPQLSITQIDKLLNGGISFNMIV